MTAPVIRYQHLKPQGSAYLILLLAVVALVGLGGYSAWTMEHAGHHITGMTNSVVWGLPHVFAISLIVAASGALNGASLASVFNHNIYKPYSRSSVALAVALLAGGLVVLVLDLGRPDRLIVAVTHFNFRSVFSWNVFLYTGFLFICVVYLWFLCEQRYKRRVRGVAIAALVWRIMLTTGTGCIFGFLVGRNALDTALLAPLFIALSLVTGTAVFALCIALSAKAQGYDLPINVVRSLSLLMLVFLISVAYFAIVHHLTNGYIAEHATSQHLVLSGAYAGVFWIGFVILGLLLPAALLVLNLFTINKASGAEADQSEPSEQLTPTKDSDICNRCKNRLLAACVAAIAGGACLLYVIVIGSQVAPQRLFPGKTVIASSFGDVGHSVYVPTVWEWGLGVGGVAFALLLFMILTRVFPFTGDQQL